MTVNTYDQMIFEFDSAFPYLRQGGNLATDDVNWNSAFPDFYKRHGMTPFVVGNESFSFKGAKGSSLEEILG